MKKVISSYLTQQNKFYNSSRIILIISSVFVLINSCKKNNDESNEPEFKLSKNVIELNDNSVIEKKLKVENIKPQYTESELKVNGTVKVIPDLFAQIASPYTGRITKSFVTLGQCVKKGDPVFEVNSSEYFSVQQDFFSAQQELKQAEINLNRQKDLFTHAVGIQKELEEAETDYKLKIIAVNQANAALKVFNPTSNIKLGQSLIIRSPISGKIVNQNIIIGQYLKEDHEPIVTVAELSKVWVSAQIKENDLFFLNELKNVNFSINSFPTKIFDGKIINIGQLLNEETRSVDVIIETMNNNSILKPGMFVNATLNSIGKNEIIIPVKAIFQENEHQYVFVKTGKNTYQKTKVLTANYSKNNLFSYILSGIKAGDNVVTEGGIYLMSAK